ncbi:DEAD/DEAH box helicase [Azospirillum picis]|uniref:ATP-dependent RNA helicase RhlE n=1 Tax=Azospirillum picis TaxID=488438 RepID=A0ABU0MPE4_9PROT|nr:DEAD/DEAH box helicase [Azospirillum picis]MBP2301512.1 ATP-dependent RNA helicase RhlE [Azospirillum picis]MDQ0535344.1 ATP-dependent RNA helicase RhlE [Azospirillum picis]
MTEFSGLGLIEPLLRAVAEEGYATATPIQAGTIPLLLAGRDVLGLAQTGTGKTAAFTLPMLQRLFQNKKRVANKAPRALILTPTRELALQIGDSFSTYGRHLPIRRTVIHGGVGQSPQVAAIARGTEVLIATPGRLLDLMAQNHLRLDAIELFVLDEADRMLDMGFIRDVRKVVAVLPKERQTLLFSATMPDAVVELANSILTDAERVEVTPQSTTVERINQRVLFVDRADKRRLLADLLEDEAMERTIVFARTKHGADRIADHLKKAGIAADAIHGDKSQSARVRALESFRNGELRALVATDIAARGIDIDGISHVINFDLPNEPESYVHRIGRTARAGTEGSAVSFCDLEEVGYLKDIEKTIRQPIPADTGHPYHAVEVAEVHASSKRPPKPKAPGSNRNQNNRNQQPARPTGTAPKAAPRSAAPKPAPQAAKTPQKAGKPAGALRPDSARSDQNRHDRRPAPHAVSHGSGHGANGGGKQAPRAAGTPGGNTPMRRKPSAA